MIRRKVSAVLLLRDGFRQSVLPNDAGTLFLLDGRPHVPVRKRDGYLVFTDLESGEHTLEIRRRGYLTERLTFSASGAWPWEEVVSLKPGQGYRFGADAVRVSLKLPEGKGKSETEPVWLGMPLRDTIRLTPNPGERMISDREVRVFCKGLLSALPVPGYYLACDAATPEVLLLRELDKEIAVFATRPAEHPAGTELIPVQTFRAAEDGMIHAVFPAPGTLRAFRGGQLTSLVIAGGEQSLSWDPGGKQECSTLSEKR